MRFRLLALLALLLYGCATSVQSVEPSPSSYSNYELGKEMIASVGDPAVTVGILHALPAFTPIRSLRLPYADNKLSELSPGQVWVAVLKDSEGYFLNSGLESGYYLHITPDGQIGQGWVSKENRMGGGQSAWNRDSPVFKSTKGVPLEDSFIAELIYGGKSESTIRFVYREYLDGIARPAFMQELEYDLAESTSIAFKSLRIEVLEANNSSIQFIVTDDGGLPWLPSQ